MRDYGAVFLAIIIAGIAAVVLGLVLATAHSQAWSGAARFGGPDPGAGNLITVKPPLPSSRPDGIG